ncbi:unnamed protein product [Rotaria sp. Silwood1]|nr:unnamed protein product [Rotaria sp. Silwood1]CAF3498089.1 unnamed protein product [Rotaria sp. Silwood1]CAF4563079.1 unnamed protein product [Rotaria sp. Silwood1]CAF4675266.1 unnamed protein product [Rotaria sp. Silwood1]
MKISTYILSKGYSPLFFNFSRLLSCKQYEKIQGIRENFSEYEVRLYFDKWLKSLWLAPKQWVHLTRDRSIKIKRRFLPFWNITFQGSLQCSLSTKSNLPFRHEENYYSHRQWHSFPLHIDHVSLNNINIYAAENLDTYHVQRLDVCFDNAQLEYLNEKENIIEKPTIDQEIAFNNAWILIIKPLLENMCLEQAKKIYPKFDEPRIDSLHLKIISKQEHLLYYPIYIINYNYKSYTNYTCLLDGLTGHITGDRQYSIIKVTLATFIGFYPMIKIGLFCIGSFTNFLFAFEIASDLSFTASLPIAMIVAPCVGLYARSYPKLYKQEISQVQWKQDQSKALKFTYEFTDSIEQAKKQSTLENGQTSIDLSMGKKLN